MSNPLIEAIARCSRCGFCQVNCPVYNELLEESACARGRVHLFRGVLLDQQALTEAYLSKIDCCTGCMSCTAVCPSDVHPHQVILAARAHAVKQQGLRRTKALALRGVLAKEPIHGLAFALASLAQKAGITHLVPSPLVPSGLDLNRFPLSFRPFRDQIPEHIRQINSTESIAFFVGCMIDHSLPSIGNATVHILSKLGIDVTIPRNLSCCGMPLIVSGDLDSARCLAEDNLRILNNLPVDRIVTACASCGHALLNEYRELFRDTSLAALAESVAAKTIDITALIADKLDLLELGKITTTVTYHDPCHLVRGQNISAEPRALIRAIPGIEFREMADADRCCGAGGTFQMYHPEIAWSITQRKLDNIRATRAETVITTCPACLQRLQGGLNRSHMPQRTMHVIELLDQALSVAQTNSTLSEEKL